MVVLAFDPGFGRTGWGVVERIKGQSGLTASGWGVVETSPSRDHSTRLHEIYTAAQKLLSSFNPDVVVIEKLFLSKNKTTVAGVYQAQGVLFATCGSHGISPIVIGPTQIKKGVTGSGRADKREVMSMVQKILCITEKITPDDAADALAGAIVGMQCARMDKNLFSQAVSI